MDPHGWRWHFTAMGTVGALTLYPCSALPAAALEEAACLLIDRVRALEACWTRFAPDSDLSVLNAHSGAGPLPVSADLWLLLTRMRRAWLITGGGYDPTVAPSLPALGYATTYAALGAGALPGAAICASPGLGDLILDPATRTATLPAGMSVDAGGIGKGLAADVIVRDAMALGVAGALLDLGGDIVAAGTPGHDTRWRVAVQDERDPHGPALSVLDLPAGRPVAVATSSTLARRWGPRRAVHHIIDPRTGDAAVLGLVQATVVPSAGRGWVAEAYATGALLADHHAEAWLAARPVAQAVLQHRDGSVSRLSAGSGQQQAVPA